MKKIGFLSFGHWTPSPQSRTQPEFGGLSDRNDNSANEYGLLDLDNSAAEQVLRVVAKGINNTTLPGV
jgi:hypothetical protein